ncbi:MAG: hypothetical protein L3J34_01810 [Flavobacteriaceae bacterium]|nr:hypothetical protein [Flavobacteriaceae bacterium]
MTKKGHLKIVTKIDNQEITIESHDLELFLNYTTKEMRGVLDLNKLIDDNPKLSSYLKKTEAPLMIHFLGIIPTNDFMSGPHELMTFNWPLKLTLQNKSFEINLKSSLVHVEGGYLTSCRLSAFGEFRAANLGLNDLIPGLDSIIAIQIIQTLLKNY